MKIYFTASLRGKLAFGKYYQEIYDWIKENNHQNLDDFLLTTDPQKFYNTSYFTKKQVYANANKLMKSCDILIVEVSEHSLSMGYLIGQALEMNKPVIALYFEKYKPVFLTSFNNERLQVVSYNQKNLKDRLEIAVHKASEQYDIRFNFFISPEQQRFLDFIAKKYRIPRSVYLRRLIDNEIQKIANEDN